MRKTILTLVITAMFIAAPAWAHGDEHSESHHAPAATTPADDMQTLDTGYTALQAAIGEKAFDKIHGIVETMEPAIKAIEAAHKDDAGITGTTTQIQKVLAALHTSGDAKDADLTETELRKLDGGLQLLKARLAPIKEENK